MLTYLAVAAHHLRQQLAERGIVLRAVLGGVFQCPAHLADGLPQGSGEERHVLGVLLLQAVGVLPQQFLGPEGQFLLGGFHLPFHLLPPLLHALARLLQLGLQTGVVHSQTSVLPAHEDKNKGCPNQQPQYESEVNHGYFRSPTLTKYSAICTALRAAPFLIWSPVSQSVQLLSSARSFLTRPT